MVQFFCLCCAGRHALFGGHAANCPWLLPRPKVVPSHHVLAGLCSLSEQGGPTAATPAHTPWSSSAAVSRTHGAFAELAYTGRPQTAPVAGNMPPRRAVPTSTAFSSLPGDSKGAAAPGASVSHVGPLQAVPCWLQELLQGLQHQQLPRDLDFVEIFAGKAAITRAFARAGLASRAFDIVNSEKENILHVDGLMRALSLVLRLKVGGLLWAAPPCQMWTWMSSSVHRRTKRNPRGDRSLSSVREANNIARITAGLVKLAVSRKARVCVENPGPRIFSYPPMRRALAYARASCYITYLGAFGLTLPKPITLWSNARFAPRLQRPKPAAPPLSEQEKFYTKVVRSQFQSACNHNLAGMAGGGEVTGEC